MSLKSCVNSLNKHFFYRFSPPDRLKKFGQPNSSEYSTKVARYRKWTVQSLYNLTSKFIAALKEHWPNFPATIAWIVQQIVHLLKQHSRLDIPLYCLYVKTVDKCDVVICENS